MVGSVLPERSVGIQLRRNGRPSPHAFHARVYRFSTNQVVPELQSDLTARLTGRVP